MCSSDLLFLAYLIVVTLSGYFRAWVSDMVGDPTPRYAGLMSLNPMDHIDPIGALFLILFHFGWAKYAPVNSDYIERPFRGLKLVLAYFAEIFANFVLALVSLMVLITIFGRSIISFVMPMILLNDISLKQLAGHYPEFPSWLLSCGVVLVAMAYLASVLCVLNFIGVWLRMIYTSLLKQDLENYMSLILLVLMVFLIFNSNFVS